MVVTVLVIQAIVFALILMALNMAVGLSVLQETKASLRGFVDHDIPILEKRHEWVQRRMKDIPLPDSGKARHDPEKPIEEPNPWRQFFSIMMPFVGQRHFRNNFGVTYDMEGNFASILAAFFPHYTDDELNSIIARGLELNFVDKPQFLFTENETFLYIKMNTERGSLVALADFTREIQTAGHLLLISGSIYVLAILVSALVAWFLARRSVRPVEEAFETQKQFIADAGHELKTPVSVVAANVDALAGEIGDNKWLCYIKYETQRMARLINDLLYLAKNDAGRVPMMCSALDLSRVVEASVLPFESIVFEQKKRLELEIQDGVQWIGDRGGISQVMVILLDNAIKNSPAGAQIKVSLSMEQNRRGQWKFGKGHSHPVVTVYNQGEGLSQEEMKQVFKRFYRGDASRARETGGCGLGLSIAQAIAQAHNGSITVEGQQGSWISFSLHLGQKSQPRPCLSRKRLG